METDAMMAEVIRLWTATSHTAEQDANKDAQIALYYQRVRQGKWTLRVVAKAFDNLSRESRFWPSWADVEAELNRVSADSKPQLPPPTSPHAALYATMTTQTGQMALREGWVRSYLISVQKGGAVNPSAVQIEAFRKGRDEFHKQFQNLDPAVPGNDMAIHIGEQMIKGEEQLRDRFLRD